jgi:MSHA pilin protein MshD
MMNQPPGYNTGRRQQAFSLIEAVMSLVIVSVMLVAALNVVGASQLSQLWTAQTTRGHLLAAELMVEIMSQDYEDPNQIVAFGCESGETTGSRAGFDDVDDYHGWSSSPPTDKTGTALSGLAGWTRSVAVQWADPMDPETVEPSESGVKRIRVTVKNGTRPVASLVAVRTASGL